MFDNMSHFFSQLGRYISFYFEQVFAWFSLITEFHFFFFLIFLAFLSSVFFQFNKEMVKRNRERRAFLLKDANKENEDNEESEE